jgi:hypothetical protein
MLHAPHTGGLSAVRRFRVIASALMFIVVMTTADAAYATSVSKRVAVILFKLQNYGTEWIAPDAARSVVWTSTTSVNAYYKEESFGKWEVTGKLRTDGDVFGWYTIPYDNTGTCAMTTWQSVARTAAAKDGFVASNYNAVVYVTTATGCPGRAWTSGSSVVVISGFNTATVAHELGHAFGLNHASAWGCKDALGVLVTISSTCNIWEYGDFALMGATTTFHMNAYHKGALGFFAASNTVDAKTSGIYTIYPLEQATANAQTVRIPRTYDYYGNVKDYYYLEYRQPFGFDKFAATDPRVMGVLIHVANPYNVKGRSFLLDATTPSLTNFADAALGVGRTFIDTTRKVSVTVLGVGAVATVQVTYLP